MPAPTPIKVPIPQQPKSITTDEAGFRERQELYDTIFLLKQEIEAIKTRLYTAGIP